MTMTVTTVRKLSDQNPDGLTIGDSTTDLVSFYGVSPVVQPAGNGQQVLLRGQAAGVITSYHSAQTPAIVNANTTNEQNLTVNTGTGFTMQVLTTDMIFAVNRPSSQAGLATCNVRAQASNVIAVQYANFTGVGITPSSENYGFVALRGLPTVSASLAPVAVPANTTAEQQFTITPSTTGANAGVGLPVGTLVQVNKPTNQAGLAIVGCRVVSSNVLGITYANVTAAPITPTTETYTILALNGLDAQNNSIWYGFNVGTVGAIGGGGVNSAGATTLTGLLATDITAGISKPTSQVTATNFAFPIGSVNTANTMTLYFAGIGTGLTPTASEVYGIHTIRINPVAPLLLYSPALTPVAVAANTTAEQTFTVTGLISGTGVWVNKPSSQPGLGIGGVRISGTNTLAVTYTNSSTASITPTAETYTVGNFQVPYPGAGNSVYQTVHPAMFNNANLTSAIRSAMVLMGQVAGA